MILADENIDTNIVSTLRANAIEVFSVKEEHQGISDADVIRLSKKPPRIILKEDKDFGEWVYAHKERDISVILLRYSALEMEIITSILLNLLATRGQDLFEKFTTVTTQKIRIRSLK